MKWYVQISYTSFQIQYLDIVQILSAVINIIVIFHCDSHAMCI